MEQEKDKDVRLVYRGIMVRVLVKHFNGDDLDPFEQQVLQQAKNKAETIFNEQMKQVVAK